MSDDLRIHQRLAIGLHGHSAHFGTHLTQKSKKKWLDLFCVHQPAMIDTASGYVGKDGTTLVSWLGQILAQINSKPLVVNKVSPDFKDNPKELQNVRDTIDICKAHGSEVALLLTLNNAVSASKILDMVKHSECEGFELIGASASSVTQLATLNESFWEPEMIQIPFNPIDTGLANSTFEWQMGKRTQIIARSVLSSGFLGDTDWLWDKPLLDPLRARFWREPQNRKILELRQRSKEKIRDFLSDNLPCTLQHHGLAACVFNLVSRHPRVDICLAGGTRPELTKKLFGLSSQDMPAEIVTAFWQFARELRAPFFK